MGKDRHRIVITRMMQLAVVLNHTRRGLTIGELVEKLECSRSTLYRDLDSLRHAGIGLKTDTVVGETRYSLAHWPIAAVAPTPLQLAALCLAREALDTFDGTEAVEQLDHLLARWGKLPKRQLSLKYQKRSPQAGSVVGAIDHAIAKHKQLEISYQGGSDSQAQQRKVEPIELRSSGEQLYLFAYDVARQDYRVFKTARMSNAQLLSDPAADHSQVDVDARFRRAVKTWTADEPTRIVVRLSPDKARFAAEYPLTSDQVTTPTSDGSVEITADVNGITEALNWVLSWGPHAEAISPPEFRAEAAKQLSDAAQKYRAAAGRDDGVRKAGGRKAAETTSHGSESVGTKQVVSRELGRRRARVAR